MQVPDATICTRLDASLWVFAAAPMVMYPGHLCRQGEEKREASWLLCAEPNLITHFCSVWGGLGMLARTQLGESSARISRGLKVQAEGPAAQAAGLKPSLPS